VLLVVWWGAALPNSKNTQSFPRCVTIYQLGVQFFAGREGFLPFFFVGVRLAVRQYIW
jgi:hypothetical protein